MSLRAPETTAPAVHGASRLAAVLAAGMARMGLEPTSGKQKARPAPNANELKNLQGVVRRAAEKAKKEGRAPRYRRTEDATDEELREAYDSGLLNKLIAEWLDTKSEQALRNLLPNVIDWNSPPIAETLAYLMRETNQPREPVMNRIRRAVNDRLGLEKDHIDVEVDEDELRDRFLESSDPERHLEEGDPKAYVPEDYLSKDHVEEPPDLRAEESLGDL